MAEYTRIPCRKCLLRDIPEGASLAAVIQDYIASLPEELRAGEALYESRLRHCRECEHLLRGTCLKCGCYAEARAAKIGMTCPDVPDRWAQ